MQSSSEQPLVGEERALRDDPNNGCEGDYWVKGIKLMTKRK